MIWCKIIYCKIIYNFYPTYLVYIWIDKFIVWKKNFFPSPFLFLSLPFPFLSFSSLSFSSLSFPSSFLSLSFPFLPFSSLSFPSSFHYLSFPFSSKMCCVTIHQTSRCGDLGSITTNMFNGKCWLWLIRFRVYYIYCWRRYEKCSQCSSGLCVIESWILNLKS